MHVPDPNKVGARRVVSSIVKQGVGTRVSCPIDYPARSRKPGVVLSIVKQGDVHSAEHVQYRPTIEDDITQVA